jgi:hypothetical protein
MNTKIRPAMSWGGAYLKITYAMIGIAVLPAVVAFASELFAH